MKRCDQFVCDFERRHPILFGLILVALIVLVYVAAGDNVAIFTHPGSRP